MDRARRREQGGSHRSRDDEEEEPTEETNDDRREFLRDPNPAQKLYDICKAKVEALRGVVGVTAPATKPTKKASTTEEAANEEDTEMSDDDIFNEVFPERE